MIHGVFHVGGMPRQQSKRFPMIPIKAPDKEKSTAIKEELEVSTDAVLLVLLAWQTCCRTDSSRKMQPLLESESLHSLRFRIQLMRMARQMPSANQATWAHLRIRRRLSITSSGKSN